MEILYLMLTTFFSHLSIWVVTLLEVIHDWQDFYGAMLAAGVAILIFLLTEWAKNNKERKSQIFLLHRSIAAALTNLAEIDTTITNFSNKQLARLVSETKEDIKNRQPTIRHAFVPLLHVVEISEELLKQSSGSGYIDILTIDLVNKSKDLRKIIDDINRQFESSILQNSQIVMSRLNEDSTIQSEAFLINMQTFRAEMIERDLRSSIRIYASQLIKAQVAIGKLEEWGVSKWKKSFKHLNGKDMYERLDDYFFTELNIRKAACQEVFKTPICITTID